MKVTISCTWIFRIKQFSAFQFCSFDNLGLTFNFQAAMQTFFLRLFFFSKEKAKYPRTKMSLKDVFVLVIALWSYYGRVVIKYTSFIEMFNDHQSDKLSTWSCLEFQTEKCTKHTVGFKNRLHQKHFRNIKYYQLYLEFWSHF